MARILGLTTIACFVVVLGMVTAAEANDPADGHTAKVASATEVSSGKAPLIATPAARTYRTYVYSYAPVTTSNMYYRGYRSRSYSNGIRDAASKELGLQDSFYSR